MEKMVRFGVSIESELITDFDQWIEKQNFVNRSDAIRSLIRKSIKSESEQKDKPTAGVIVMTYDHHKRNLLTKLTQIEHDFDDLIIAAQHIHLNHDQCMEILSLKGSSKKIQSLATQIQGVKGVLSSKLHFI